MYSILILAHELYEDLELWYPKIRLEEAGLKTVVAGPEANRYCLSKHGYPCKAELSFDEVQACSFHGVVIPGGFAPDKLRSIPSVLAMIRKMHQDKKMIAFICHGGWVPISAKILQGKKATGTLAIKDDLENGGAIWHNQPVVIDEHLISSRTPADLAAFAKGILNFLLPAK